MSSKTSVFPRVTVIGAGYLGLTHAVCMADLGHEVLAIDVDTDKIAKAAAGEAPFFEPGLEPLLRKNVDAGRLRFTTSFAEVGEFGDVHFLCVGTPQTGDGAADLSYVHAAADALAPHLRSSCLIVGKSTVPVGTARALLTRIRDAAPAGSEVDLAWNPEFLREGYAVQDSLTPDRFVFGVLSPAAVKVLRRVYAKPLAANIPALVMDLETAELVKVAANAFLATKISFINAMAEVCEAAGADVVRLAGSGSGLERERRHAALIIPAAMLRELARLLTGDGAAVTRMMANIAGLASAAGGYATGRMQQVAELGDAGGNAP